MQEENLSRSAFYNVNNVTSLFLEQRSLLQGQARRMGGFMPPQTLNSPEGSSKAFLKAREGGIAAG